MDAKVLVVFLIVLVLALSAAKKVLLPRVSLANGSWKGEGRVEIFFFNELGTVCDDDWDMNDARVVCRQLGFPDAVSAPRSAHFGAGSGKIWLDDVGCSGNESSIADCPHRGWRVQNCNHNEDASVICSRLRLVGGSWKGEGRVEIFHNGRWGTVCDDGWNMDDAHVVCRQLGYQSAVSAPDLARFGAGSGPIWLDDVFCSGSEISIADCMHKGWGEGDCRHREDASVICLSICKPGYIGDGRTCSPNGLQDSIIAGYNINNLTPLNKWLSLVIRSVYSRWRRCWRASLDGWAASTFHSRCDGKGPTVTIVRVGKYIFGGYASVSWASHGGYQYDSKAFLFSLVNKPGWAPVKLPQTAGRYSSQRAHSLYFGSSYGPTFGLGFDLRLTSYASSHTNSHSNLGNTYNEPPIGKSYRTYVYSAQTFLVGSYYFKPDEIETFYETT